MILKPPPPVPAGYLRECGVSDEHFMVWVHNGHAHVKLADGTGFSLVAGQGIWLPPIGAFELWTDSGTLAFPMWLSPREVTGMPTQVVRFTVADSWRDWLVAQFAREFTTYNQVNSAELLRILGAVSSAQFTVDGTSDRWVRPVMPQHGAALRIAQTLTANPGLDHTVEEWARLTHASVSTLRRTFLRDTGMSFSQWRNRIRLAAARELIADGYGVAQVAARVGFASRHGFSRAFRDAFEMSPHDYSAHVAHLKDPRSRRILAGGDDRAVEAVLGANSSTHYEVSPGVSAPRTAPYSVLTWMYRGTGWARVGREGFSRLAGDALWLPAGIERETRLPAGALALPIGVLDEHGPPIPAPIRTRFPASWDPYLLHYAVSTNTPLRPDNFDPSGIVGVFADRLAQERELSVPIPSAGSSRRFAREFLRRLDDAGSTTGGEMPAVVRADFELQVGMSLSRWKLSARMQAAREGLTAGMKIAGVARRVGYTQPSNFSRTFSEFHGMSPRDFLEFERRPEID